ncbi:amidohydrolase [Streptomyces sp. TLI_185]|uniref:amidohydrolase n=1 Tax=Streptomyces sp. TLI_185 TaxID=2485151 RepID=UPI0021A6D26D|nr:amidohydrolase family protein [Streptomyces sp. TLI_185]
MRGRSIVAVGSDAEMRALAGPGTRVVGLGGQTVLPGINDSHLHGAAYGMTKPPFAIAVGHPAVGSIADITAAVGRAVQAARPGEWIIGLGWDPGYLAECLADPRRFPHRRDLDTVAPDNPVCLTDFSSHMAWVNSAALRRCGVGASSVPPGGGVIDLGPDGESTGILREAAQGLVQAALPSPTVEQRRHAIQNVIAELHSRGITGYTEPGLGPGGATTLFGGLSTDNWTAYADLAATGELRARISVLLLRQRGRAPARRPALRHPRRLHRRRQPRQARRARLRAQHEPRHQVDDLRPDGRGRRARAVRRPVARTVRRRGRDRGLRQFGRTDHRARLAAGVAAMMLRESKASGRPSGPDQCVGLAEALRAYTVNAARQDFAEEWKGTVEAGKVADLCVLDRPLLDLDPHAIADAEVDLTVFDRCIVHER